MNDTIFGYSWEDIQRAQQGGRLARPIKPTTDTTDYLPIARAALAEHGVDGLKAQGFHGYLDILRRAGDIA